MTLLELNARRKFYCTQQGSYNIQSQFKVNAIITFNCNLFFSIYLRSILKNTLIPFIGFAPFCLWYVRGASYNFSCGIGQEMLLALNQRDCWKTTRIELQLMLNYSNC